MCTLAEHLLATFTFSGGSISPIPSTTQGRVVYGCGDALSPRHRLVRCPRSMSSVHARRIESVINFKIVLHLDGTGGCTNGLPGPGDYRHHRNHFWLFKRRYVLQTLSHASFELQHILYETLSHAALAPYRIGLAENMSATHSLTVVRTGWAVPHFNKVASLYMRSAFLS